MQKRRVPKPALPPRGLRPKLRPDQVRDLSIVHFDHIAAIQSGKADEERLLQFVASALVWWHISIEIEAGQDEMRQHLVVIGNVIQRFNRLGKVGFAGPELEIVKLGCDWMEDLAGVVEKHIASASCDWAEAHLSHFRLRAIEVLGNFLEPA